LREDGTYRIASDLREICLFSAHNLLIDPPFSKLDLISCRNLLIYLNSDLQNRIIPLFHYALNHNGYLFLGTSENVTAHTRLFAPLAKGQRIFHRRAHLERQVPQFPLTAPETSRSIAPRITRRGTVVEPSVRAAAERQVLDLFSPAYVVVNSDGDVLQASGRTGKYLELPSGTPDTNVFNMARAGLRLDLRTALHKATSTGQPAARLNVILGVNGGRQEVDIRVQPLPFETPPETVYLIVFQDRGPVDAGLPLEELPADDVEGTTVRQLEIELRATKDRLQTATEELESSNEELKSGNEELQSTNEELQSTNEELQTSKEELQSINEELQTVNSELNARVEELSRANNDMSNLLESTQIATVFLDRTLAVKSFTPAAKDVFRLVESDAGRPIMHVRARFDWPSLQDDAERVLRTLTRIERHVSSTDSDTRYIMRMLPYRTSDNVINGIVLTFTDITQISEAEAQIVKLTADLRARISELETLLELVPAGVMISDDGAGVLINNYGARLLGQTASSRGLTAPAPFRLIEAETELAREDQPLERARRTGEPVPGWQGRLVNGSGQGVHVMISATPLFGDDHTVRGAIAAIVDITAHKQAEEHQRLLLDELQHRVKNILATVGSLASRMARTSRTVEEFQTAFLERIGSMGRIHDLLVQSAWKGASLQSLVEVAVEPFTGPGGKNVVLTGPNVTLSADPAGTIGMVLNELATNASKYGALSVAEGSVDVAWQLIQGTGEQKVQLTWVEKNGPAVRPDSGAGFGTALITRSVEYELQGSASLTFAAEGLRCTIEFPLAQNSSSIAEEEP
jgi:two-component system CheB/CheR fusion protein